MDWKLKVLIGISVFYVGIKTMEALKEYNACKDHQVKIQTIAELPPCQFKLKLNPFK